MEETEIEDESAALLKDILLSTDGNLQKITVLDLSARSLCKLPTDLTSLTNLRTINLSGNLLDHLPKVLEKFLHLEEMILSDNQICNLDTHPSEKEVKPSSEDCIYTDEELKPIETRDEPDFSLLPRLNLVDLSGNKLIRIPDSINRCKAIVKLDVSYNSLRTLPSRFDSHSVINHLILDGNLLTHVYNIPIWISRMRRCTFLSLRFCYLDMLINTIPRDVGASCRQILQLDIRNCGVKAFPVSFTGFLDLEVLRIGNVGCDKLCATEKWCSLRNNSIFDLPAEFTNLVGLVHIEARDIGLSKLPDDFGSLLNLTDLDLSKNCLDWLPESLKHLVNLRTLNISHNQLICIILDWQSLTKLKVLNLSFNQIYSVPNEIFQLENLETLDIYSNYISEVMLKTAQSLNQLDLGENLISREKMVRSHGEQLLQQYLIWESNLRRLDYTKSEERKTLQDVIEECAEEEEVECNKNYSSGGSDWELDSWLLGHQKEDEVGQADHVSDCDPESLKHSTEADLDTSSESENWTSFVPKIKDEETIPPEPRKRRTRTKKEPDPGQFENAESDDELQSQASHS